MTQDISEELLQRRIALNLRLEDASQMSGLSIPTIRLLEGGRGNLSSLLQYLRALKLRMHWMGVMNDNHGASIAARRQSLRISQRALAKKVGVSHRTIVVLEKKFRGRVDTLLDVLVALRLTLTLRPAKDTSGDDDTAIRVDYALRSLLGTGDGAIPNTALIEGDALEVLRRMPSSIIDCVMTSPPYWRQRTYAAGGLGEEQSVVAFLNGLRAIFKQVHRVLKARGSLWINIDDSYHQRSMQGIPWRLILGLIEDSGWLVRNDVIWHKSGGALNRANNRMTHRHEHVFHLVKQEDYFFDADAIRFDPVPARLDGPEITTATGLTLVTCLHRISSNDALTYLEQQAASDAVRTTFAEIADGQLHDFRLVLRGGRVTHSDSVATSARATRLDERGFYILRYDPKGSLPGDVWNIAPERTKGREVHYAAYPEALCERPILSTCPVGGVVLDPFMGSGTTMLVAQKFGRNGIGIDLSDDYLKLARARLVQPHPLLEGQLK